MTKAWLLSQEPVVEPGVPAAAARRALRSDANVDHRAWGAPIVGKTPARNVQRFYGADPQNEHQRVIQERRKNCLGLVMFRTHRDAQSGKLNPKGKGARGPCAFCAKPLTNVWCAGCHTWLCGPHVEIQSDLRCNVIVNTVRSPFTGTQKTVCFRNSCWHEWHAVAYNKQFELAAASTSRSEDTQRVLFR
jgi:hypothetical protein